MRNFHPVEVNSQWNSTTPNTQEKALSRALMTLIYFGAENGGGLTVGVECLSLRKPFGKSVHQQNKGHAALGRLWIQDPFNRDIFSLSSGEWRELINQIAASVEEDPKVPKLDPLGLSFSTTCSATDLSP